MPSTSKSQQRLMGVAYAVKSGDMQLSDVDVNYRDKVKDLVDGMSLKDLKDFAETKHDGLPEEVEEGISPASIGGMGPIQLPTDTEPGSGDVPANAKSDEDEEDEKEQVKEMKDFIPTFEQFISEARDFNDPLLIKMRAAQMKAKKDAEAKANAPKPLSPAKAKKLAKLKAERAELLRDMEQEAEMEGGEVADRYGKMLNKIDKEIAKLGGHDVWGPEDNVYMSKAEIKRRARSIRESYTEDDINMSYGFYGTINVHEDDKTTRKLFDRSVKDLMKAFKLSEEEALAVLNSKMGRKAADQIVDGSADTVVLGLEQYYGNKLKSEMAKVQRMAAVESLVFEMDSEGIQSLADELNAEVYTATLKDGAKSVTIEATTTTKTWPDGAPVLKYLARGKAKKMAFNLYQRPFKVLHDVPNDWFYFTDGRKWYGLHGDEGYYEPEDLPFDMKIAESIDEAKKSDVYVAARKGSYPATIVVVKKGKVVHQQQVNTPQEAPAVWSVIQGEYPNGKIHLEDKTGKILIRESEELNESEWVAYISYPRGKKLVKTLKSHRAAVMWNNKNVDSILMQDNVEGVGIMSKEMWDNNEAEWAVESIDVNEESQEAYTIRRLTSDTVGGDEVDNFLKKHPNVSVDKIKLALRNDDLNKHGLRNLIQGKLNAKMEKQALAHITESIEVTEARSIRKIQNDYDKVVQNLLDTKESWKDCKASGDAKGEAKCLADLKELTAKKKALISELDAAIGLKDVDAELE